MLIPCPLGIHPPFEVEGSLGCPKCLSGITIDSERTRVRFKYKAGDQEHTIEVRLSRGEGIVVRSLEGSLQVQPRHSNEVGIFVWD